MALGCVALALAGCAASIPSPPVPSTAPPPAPASGAFAPPGDEAFLRDVGASLTGVADADAIEWGGQVCRLFREGGTGQAASAALIEQGLSIDQSVVLIRAAVLAYCPAYEDATLN